MITLSMRKVVVETIEDEVELPKFFSTPQANTRVEPVDFQEIAKRSISMSLPAFLVVLVFVMVVAFFAGKFSVGDSSASQVASTQKVPEPVVLGQTTATAPVAGTPDEIIKQARSEFASAIQISKQSNLTEAQKDQISKNILSVLDQLTKGMSAYPDVASLIFERAQVEKMVMQSAPSLKNQAASDYQKAISIAPLSSEYYIGYADYFDVLGDKPKSIDSYEKAVKLAPNSVDALYPLAKLYSENGRTSEALTMYKKVASLLSPSSAQYTQVQQEMLALQPPIDATASASVPSM